MSNPSDCAKSISAMVKEWTQPVLAGGINIPPNLIDRRMARFEPSPALAALAMRERAADKLSEILDGWEVIRKYHQPGSFAGDAAVKSIRALPTTFTNAELLAAAMQLPEVRALVGALDDITDAITALNQFGDSALTITGPTGNLKWLISSEDDARAALAPFTKCGDK